MSAITYAETRKNMRLGDYFETEKENDDAGDHFETET